MDLKRQKPSKNVVDRTWIKDIHHHLNMMLDFLNMPREAKKSFKDPYNHSMAHARPMVPSDPALLRSFFDPDNEPDQGSIRKSESRSDMYDKYMMDAWVRRMKKEMVAHGQSPMTEDQILGGY